MKGEHIDFQGDITSELQREFKAMEEDYKSRSLHEIYGIKDSELANLETPFIEWDMYYRVPYKFSWILQQKLKPFSRVVTWYGKLYFRITGTMNEMKQLQPILPNGVQRVHSCKVWERNVIFSADRWIRLPEIGIPLKVQHS